MHLLLIGGLGDHEALLHKALPVWRLRGYETHIFPFGWQQPGGSYLTREQALLDYIDALPADVKLDGIGSSAGGIALLRVFLQRPERFGRISTICSPVNRRRHSSNKFLIEGLELLWASHPINPALLDRVGSFRAKSDKIVDPSFSILDGARNFELPTYGHMATIVLALTVLSGRIAKWLRAE